MQKPILAALLVVATTCCVPYTARAADTQESTAPSPTRAFPAPDEVVRLLDSKLSLSDEQKSAITPIIADRQDKLKALLADGSSRPLKRRRRMKEIVGESDKQINSILTPAQQKQYAQIEQQMREQLKQRMQQHKTGAD